jgi:hypothetical protein
MGGSDRRKAATYTNTNSHDFSGIRTHDPRVRAGHCDRHVAAVAPDSTDERLVQSHRHDEVANRRRIPVGTRTPAVQSHQTNPLRLMVSGLGPIPKPSFTTFQWCPVSQAKYRSQTYPTKYSLSLSIYCQCRGFDLQVKTGTAEALQNYFHAISSSISTAAPNFCD